MTKEKAIIFDIDGTLADISHRLELFKQGKKKEFYGLMGDDGINEPVLMMLEALNTCYKINFLFVTGRMERHRAKTAKWLFDNTCYSGKQNKLLMRKENDYRNDAIVKKEIYEEYIKDNYDVIAVFDDRKRVVEMWLPLGLFVFDVGQGKGDF